MIKNNFHRFKSNAYRFKLNKKLKFRFGVVLIAVVIIFGLFSYFPHFFRSTYIVTIANKQIKRESNSNKYLIYTEMQDGNTKVFENTDSLLEFKFDSADIYGGLRINRRYEIKTYGFGVPLLSLYQNIVKVKAIR